MPGSTRLLPQDRTHVAPWRRYASLAERYGLGLLLALACAAFLPSLGFGFVYDDAFQLVGNPNVHGWRGLVSAFSEHVWSFDSQKSSRYYRPLFAAVLTLAWQAFGQRASGYHALTLALHLGCGALLWRVARALALPVRARIAATAIFLLHPLQIQAAVWISAISEPMFGLTALTCVLAWLRWLQGGGTRFAVLAVALYGTSLLILERAVALAGPLLLLAWYRTRLFDPSASGEATGTRVRALTRHALLLTLPVLAVFVLRRTALGPGPAPPSTWIVDTWQSAPAAALRYLVNVALPLRLSVAYPESFIAVPAAANFARPLLVVSLALGFCAWLSRDHPRRRVLLGSAVLLMAPAVCVGLLPGYGLVQDRYGYLPLAFVGLWLSDLTFGESTRSAPWGIHLGRALVGVWLFVAISQHRPALAYWKDNLSLFRRAVEVAPDNPAFLMDLALEEHGHGLPAHGCRRLLHAASILERYPRSGPADMVYYELGNCLQEERRLEAALRAYELALHASGGGMLRAGVNRVRVLAELARLDDAVSAAEDLTRRHRDSPVAWKTLIVASAQRGDLDKAAHAAERAIALDPNDVAARELLERVAAAAARDREP